MQVGDIVLSGKSIFRITGIYLGGMGTQNLVGLESVDRSPGYAHGECVVEMLVPENLVLFSGGVYRRVD